MAALSENLLHRLRPCQSAFEFDFVAEQGGYVVAAKGTIFGTNDGQDVLVAGSIEVDSC